MKPIRTTFIIAALALLATGASAQGLNYNLFKPTTLAEAKADFLADAQEVRPGVPDKVGNSYLEQGGRRWKANAAYSGRSRALDPEDLVFIGYWLKSVSRGDMIAKYTTSYLFTVDGKDYWLPVQQPVAEFFIKELKPGDRVDLYLAEIGGTHRKDGWVWLPLVEEFQKLENRN
jgi:hypothetical protein